MHLQYTYYYDGLNKTLVNKNASGLIIDSYSYTYDDAHNQTSKTDSKGVTQYKYDSLNRLVKTTEPNGKETSYTFDQAGNRLTETIKLGTTSVTTKYTYNEQNRLMSTVCQSGGQTVTDKYRYDNNGNTINKTTETVKPIDSNSQSKATVFKAGQSPTGDNACYDEITQYEYDVWNQLIKTTVKDKKISYSYNGEGYRVSKDINGQSTNYLYEADKVILETDGENNQTAKNIYGLNLLTRTAGNDTMNYMYNGHADVTALLNQEGTVTATYYYDAFGNIVEQTGNVNNNITYAGYQYDGETGLYYLNARMYDPKIARFLQEDTYEGDRNDPLSLNLYTYCLNNPIRYDDPTGHLTQEEAMKYVQEKAEVKTKLKSQKNKIKSAEDAKKYVKKLEEENDKVNKKHNMPTQKQQQKAIIKSDAKEIKKKQEEQKKAQQKEQPKTQPKKDSNKVDNKGTGNGKSVSDKLKDETGKNAISGVIDGIAGATVIDKLKNTSKSVTKMPGLGVAAEVETVTINSGVKALKGVSKIAGPAAVVTTAIDVIDDFNTYEGNDRYKAAGLSIAGTIIAGVIVGATVIATAPLAVVVGAGIVVGVGVGLATDYLKDEYLQKKK